MTRWRKRRHRQDDEPPEDMALQITSMADIFTILLVFLLKSFSTGLAVIQPPSGMHLPSLSTSATEEMKEALRLEILPDAILVDQKPAFKTKNFRMPSSVSEESLNAIMADPTVSPVYEPVYQALTRAKASSKNQIVGENSPLMILADERTPYSTIHVVMASAADAGYLDLQLVVLGGD